MRQFDDRNYQRGDVVVDISFRELWELLKRRVAIAALVGLMVAALVFVMSMRQKPMYASEALVLIDRSERQVVDSPASDVERSDSTVVDTEVEVLKSRKLARRVADKLDLYSHPVFIPTPPTGLRKWALGATRGVTHFLWQSPDPEIWLSSEELVEQRKNASIDKVLNSTKVRRNGLTYVIAIRARTPDPSLSAAVANEFAHQYVLNQVQSKFDSSQVLNDWVGSRLDELRNQVETAEAAVDSYRRQAGLLNVTGADLVERQIVELSNEIAAQRRKLEDSEAKLAIARESQTSDALSPVLTSDRIVNLRATEAQILDEKSELQTTLGPSHPDVAKVENRLKSVERELSNEIARIVSSLESDVAANRRGVEAGEARLRQLQSKAVQNNTAIVNLTELERQASASRSLYEQFLARNQELTAMTELEQPGAQILSEAVIPARPYAPSVRLQLAIALLVGAAAGFLTIVWREIFESRFLSPKDIYRATGVTCLTTVPNRKGMQPIHEEIAGKPFSYLSECVRRILTELEMRKTGSDGLGKVATIVASGRHEGKTTMALGLAIVARNAGHRRILLIDADMRKNSLTKALDMAAGDGLHQVLSGEIPYEQAIQTSAEFGFDVLPSDFDATYPAIVNELAVKELLLAVREKYDLIIVDTAPLLAISETRYFVRYSDDLVALIRWKSTTQEDTKVLLSTLEGLGKAPSNFVMTRYEGQSDSYSANQSYYSARA